MDCGEVAFEPGAAALKSGTLPVNHFASFEPSGLLGDEDIITPNTVNLPEIHLDNFF